MLLFVNRVSPLLLFLLLFFQSCSSNEESDTSYLETTTDYVDTQKSIATAPIVVEQVSVRIPYTEMDGNTITIPVNINGLGLDMIFDTGASTTCITLAEAQYMYQKGTFTKDDIIDLQQFQTADGNISVGLRIVLKDVSIGNKINLHNIETVVVKNLQAPLLLGQSVMKNFRKISVDRESKELEFFQ